MAVFTNIDNTLKETINVNYRTRETNQKVRFCCEENEYWGTFRGVLSVDGATIGNCSLHDAEIDGAVFSNVRFKDGIDFSNLNETVCALSLSFDEMETTVEGLLESAAQLDAAIKKEEHVRSGETTFLSGVHDALASKVDFEIERLDGRISADFQTLHDISVNFNERIEANKLGLVDGMDRSDRQDAFLSVTIDNLSTDLSLAIDYLSATLSDEIRTRTEETTYLSGRVDGHTEDISYLSGQLDGHTDDIAFLSGYLAGENGINERLITVEKKIKSGVIYKGTLEYRPDMNTFRALFNYDPNNFPLDTVLEAGFMYMVKPGCEIEGVKIGANDYIIINKDTTVNELTKDDIDHLDAMDDDLVRENEFNEVKTLGEQTAAKFDGESGLLKLRDEITNQLYELAVMDGAIVLKVK